LILRLTRSWLGHEDTQLTERLLGELPGILDWSIQGLRRLRQRGHFVQPESAASLLAEMERLSSPIAAFLADRCEIDPEAEVPRQALYTAWCQWCEANHIKHPGTQASFGRDLRAVMPEVDDTHPRIDGRQTWCYRGIRLGRGGLGAITMLGARPAAVA
jgi:putative DNA primase/helicase